MRTIAILFALTVVAATAPSAASSLDYLVPALLLFTAALAVLVLSCLVVGWRVFELRTRTRMAPDPAPAVRNPDLLPALQLATVFPVVNPGAAARDARARLSGRRASYSPSLGDGYHSGRIAPGKVASPARGPSQRSPGQDRGSSTRVTNPRGSRIARSRRVPS